MGTAQAVTHVRGAITMRIEIQPSLLPPDVLLLSILCCATQAARRQYNEGVRYMYTTTMWAHRGGH